MIEKLKEMDLVHVEARFCCPYNHEAICEQIQHQWQSVIP